MEAKEAILRLINRYCFTIDGGDLEGFARLFEHGEYRIEGFKTMVGRDQVLDFVSNVILYEDGTPKTRHLTTNLEIDVSDDGQTARAQCYVTILQQTAEFPLQMISSGHYFDDFECVDGQWRFARRVVRNVLMGDASAHLRPPS